MIDELFIDNYQGIFGSELQEGNLYHILSKELSRNNLCNLLIFSSDSTNQKSVT